jgi:hypothetical protein
MKSDHIDVTPTTRSRIFGGRHDAMGNPRPTLYVEDEEPATKAGIYAEE